MKARSALAMPVLVTLCAGFLIIGGQVTALTYLAAFLGRVTGISGGGMSTFLLVFGLATAAGVLASAWSVDRSPAFTPRRTGARHRDHDDLGAARELPARPRQTGALDGPAAGQDLEPRMPAGRATMSMVMSWWQRPRQIQSPW